MRSLLDVALLFAVISGVLYCTYRRGYLDGEKTVPFPVIGQRMLNECSERLTECQDTLREYGIKEK